MLDFVAGRVDVLVCTTIIESGLDIPNVNTIIINKADKLGLAQLYQLRGRVGRGAARAYAYLLFDKYRSLSELAQKRLQAIFEATELGAGFQIALRDLEIRGAGNLLGAEQSGHISAVGFDLYMRLLADAVERLKAIGEGRTPPLPRTEQPPLTIDLPLDDLARSKVAGEYQFANNALTVDPGLPPIERAAGRVSFTDSTLTVHETRGQFFGGPVAISGGSKPDAGIVIAARGEATAPGMRALFDHPWRARLAGGSPYSASVAVRTGSRPKRVR